MAIGVASGRGVTGFGEGLVTASGVDVGVVFCAAAVVTAAGASAVAGFAAGITAVTAGVEPSLAGGATGGSTREAAADATDVEMVMGDAAGTATEMTLSGLGAARDEAGVEVTLLLAYSWRVGEDGSGS